MEPTLPHCKLWCWGGWVGGSEKLTTQQSETLTVTIYVW